MQTKVTTHIIIDKLKLDLLLRLGCKKDVIFDAICCGKITKTGDQIIDDLLEALLDVKKFKNWGGRRKGAGRKGFHLEIQDDNQLENQDCNQNLFILKHKHKHKLENKELENKEILVSGIRAKNIPTEDEVLEYARTQNECAGMGGFACSPDVAHDFYDYYTGIGWVVPNDTKTPIVDWRPFLRKWARNPNKFRRTPNESEKRNIDDPNNFVI